MLVKEIVSLLDKKTYQVELFVLPNEYDERVKIMIYSNVAYS